MEDPPIVVPQAHRLDISRDSEMLQRFVRVNLDESDNANETDIHSKIAIARHEASVAQINERVETEEKQKIPAAAPDQPSTKSGNNIEKEVKKKGLRRRRKSRLRQEELYTDKDRAAAVNMGTRDIKQSLKLKRKQDRSKALSIPEEAEPGTFLALGNYEMCRGDLYIALDFMNKALELNPAEKKSLVARSKCYILLGQPENGLKDAETALSIDKNFMKAIYQKAESLYYLGDFEHSLMYYHRGLHLRPDHEGFKLGVHKAQKAIENAIGGAFPGITTSSRISATSTRCSTKQSGCVTNKSGTSKIATASSPETICNKSDMTEKTATVRNKQRRKSRLLRELGADKEYLDNLLINPNLKCMFKENDNEIIDCIQGAVDFLNKRQEFWRQQLPPQLK